MIPTINNPVRPQPERLLLGLILAPSTPMIPLGWLVFSIFPGLWFLTAVVGAALYLLFRDHLRPTVTNMSLSGALTGFISWSSFYLISTLSNYFEIVQIKHISLSDYLRNSIPGDLFPYLLSTALGFVGGVVFWLCVVWRDPRFEAA